MARRGRPRGEGSARLPRDVRVPRRPRSTLSPPAYPSPRTRTPPPSERFAREARSLGQGALHGVAHVGSDANGGDPGAEDHGVVLELPDGGVGHGDDAWRCEGCVPRGPRASECPEWRSERPSRVPPGVKNPIARAARLLMRFLACASASSPAYSIRGRYWKWKPRLGLPPPRSVRHNASPRDPAV